MTDSSNTMDDLINNRRDLVEAMYRYEGSEPWTANGIALREARRALEDFDTAHPEVLRALRAQERPANPWN